MVFSSYAFIFGFMFNAREKYFKKIFMYEFPTTGLDEVNKETNDESDNKAYRQTYIGLIDIDAINRNKMIINNLFVNSSFP